VWPSPPEAPKKRAGGDAPAPKEAKPAEAKLPNPAKEKDHTPTPAEIAPIHKVAGRILGKLGDWLGYENWKLSAEEMDPLNTYGAQFWGRWIRSSWAASGIAYGASLIEVSAARAFDAIFATPKQKGPGTRTPEASVVVPSPAPVAQSTITQTTPVAGTEQSKPQPVPITDMIDAGETRDNR
jgi:hypothetical protein